MDTISQIARPPEPAPPSQSEPEIPQPRARAISPFEFLPAWITYGPVVAQWIWLGLRYGDASLPTAANPRITTGGLCGESKSAILDLVGGAARHSLAPYTTLITGHADPQRTQAAIAQAAIGQAAIALAAIDQAGFGLPLVVKPDIGCNGTGVRLARSQADLARTLAAFPRGIKLVLQRLIEWEGEAGIFYIRHPDEPAGRISSLTLKYAPMVTGDGATTLRGLIMADPRHARLRHLYLTRLADRLDDIPPAGQRVRLVFAGNHCKGSIFRNGATDITPALTAAIDAIARAIPDFHFGRIDVRYQSRAQLRQGQGFSIIEINGVGSEATHIWDPDTTLRDVFRVQLSHYAAAFAIGHAMRRRGARPSGVRTMWRDWRAQGRLMASYPLND